jgi:Dynamin family
LGRRSGRRRAPRARRRSLERGTVDPQPRAESLGTLSGGVAALCDDAIPALRDQATRGALADIRAKLSEPLRVAIAGSVSSGKSTLVNALLGRSVAPVDASDCTKVLTWFRFGFPERVDVVGHDGGVRTHALGSGEPLAQAAGPLDGVASLVVWLSNERLRTLTLIDTPGLDSIDPERERATEGLLGLGDGSDPATAAADALVLMMPLARRLDADVLERFAALSGGGGLTAVNAVGVISKADRLAAPGEDPWPVAHEATRQATADLAPAVGHVAAVAGLIAATALAGELTEADARALAALGDLPADDFDDALLSAGDLLAAELSVSDSHRRRLLSTLDLYGIRVAAAVAATGGASAVVDALQRASGFDALDAILTTGFAQRADTLKAHMAASALDRLSYRATGPDDERVLRRLRDPLDRLAAEPEFHELRLLEIVRHAVRGELELPAELALDVERIARHAERFGRLGLDVSADKVAVRAAAADAAARWAAWGNDPRRTAEQLTMARDMRTAYEWIWHGA